jgi:predicted ribonuclease YlaK
MKQKTYVVDTSALIEDPDIFYKLGRHEIVIPTAVIGEIDRMKKDSSPHEPRAKAARKVARTLDRLGSHQDISRGAKTSGGSIVRISNDYIDLDQPICVYDKRVIGTAVWLKESRVNNVVLVSKDRNMRTMTRAYRIMARDYPFIPNGKNGKKGKEGACRYSEDGNLSEKLGVSSRIMFLKCWEKLRYSLGRYAVALTLFGILFYLMADI